jgi:transcriptional regulator with PAS, ATPase and Fis domain
MERDQLTKIKAVEAMRKHVTIVSPDTTVMELNELMILNKQEEVVVTNSEGQIIGIITKNDLAKNLARGVDKDTVVKYIMTPNVICMPPDKDLAELRDEMRKAGIGRAPVVDKDGEILGILTVKSICDGFSGRLEEVVNYLYDILDGLEDCIIATDTSGNIIFSNRAAEDEFAICNNVRQLCLDDVLPQNMAKVIIESKTNVKNMRLIRNKKQFLLNTYHLSYREKSYGIIINLRDITDIKLLSDELDKTNIRLKYLQEKVDNLPTDHAKFGKVYTENNLMKKVLEISERTAKTTATILITGESGTGKEVLAKAIYEASDRRDKPFITINCGAIPHNLLESELFGYEQGAFTGANKYGKSGIFELADGGTIFLDEIGELPLDMQVKLLRFLEDKVFYRVGGINPIRVDVRVIAATNRDLEIMIKENKFRQDLYYRINVIKLDIPPLRHRKEDIPYLISEFLNDFCRAHRKNVKEIDKEVMKILLDYSWKGNIRELKNVVERMVILSRGDRVILEDLPPYLLDKSKNSEIVAGKLDVVLSNIERNTILNLMKKHNGNKTKVARELNIPRTTLYYKLKNLGIKR